MYKLSIFYLLLLFPFSLIGQGLFVPNQVLVQFKDRSANQRFAAKNEELSYQKIGNIPAINVELWKLPNRKSINGRQLIKMEDWIQYLQKDSNIVTVQPNYLYGTSSLPPNDTAFYKQWYLQNTGWNGCDNGIDIRALAAWDIRNNAKYAKVAIMDTGIEWAHPDLKENIWQNLKEDADHDSTTIVWNGSTWILDPGDLNGIDDDNNGYIDDVIGWDFIHNDNNPMDDNGHGTHVSGIIGAKANNTIGIAGIAGAGIQLMPLKCLDESGTGYSFSILLAMQYAINQGAIVTNHSYGGGAYDPLMFSYIDNNCKQAGQLLVAAAGNTHINNDTDPMYPASYDSDIIISVGAHDCKGNLASFSNFGSQDVDIFAPGDAIYSTDLNGQYTFRSGTSMAAPMVTAAVALAWKQFPASTQANIKGRILHTAKKEDALNNLGKANGRLDLEAVLGRYNDEVTSNNTWQNFQNNNIIFDIASENDKIWAAYQGGLISISSTTGEIVNYKTDNSGLKGAIVTSIKVDNYGNKWIGTYTGLSKFSGTNWLGYDTTNCNIISNDILSLWADSVYNNIWIGTSKGVSKFDGVNWINYTTSNCGIVNNYINDVRGDSSGNIWFATNNGVSKFDGTNWTNYNQYNSGLPTNSIYSMYIDKANKVWFTSNSGITTFNGAVWTNYTSANIGFTCYDIRAISEDTNGHKYFGSYQGLVKFDGITWTKDTAVSSIRCIEIDKNGFIWTGTYGQVKMFNGNIWTSFNTANSLYNFSGVTVITIDNQNKKWFGHTGIAQYDNYQWFHYPVSLVGGNVSDIAIDNMGNKWIATSGGLTKFDGSNWLYYNITNSNIIANYTRKVVIDVNNNKWVGTNYGLSKFDGVNWTNYTMANSNLLSDAINTILCEGSNIWVGTYLGVSKFDGINWTNYDTTNSGLINNIVYCIVKDINGSIWFATEGGISKFNGTNWVNYTISNSGLPSNDVKYLAFDLQNNLWVASEGGVSKFDGYNWTNYNTYNSPLVGNQLTMIAIDNQNNKWLVNNGLGFQILYDVQPTFSTPTFITCLNSSLTFLNQTTDADSFSWKIDNIPITTTTNLTYTFTTAGVKRVELIAYKGNIQKSFFQYITVRQPVQVDLGKDTSVCHGSFVIETKAAAQTYRWRDVSGTLLDADSIHAQLMISGLGVHTVVLEAKDYCGAIDRDTLTVTLSGDCVLPGDINADGAVDVLDFITIAPLQGMTGSPRPNASTQLVYQICANWGNQPNSLVDKKHGDPTGDGTIDILTDGAIIKQNATRILPSQKGTDSTVYELRLKRLNYSPYKWYWPGDTIWHDVELSREDGLPLTNIGRMSFNVRYNRNIIRTPILDLQSSFLGNVGINLFPIVIRKDKRVDFGQVRLLGGTTGTPKSSTGKVGTVPSSEKIDTTHTTHAIFLNMTLNNSELTLGSGNKVRVHSQTTHNTETMEVRLPWNRLELHAILQGAYIGTTMRTDLQNQNLIPSKHPYGDIPPFKAVEIPADGVDWVEVQLRTASNPNSANIVDRRAAFLMSDGTIQSPYIEDSGKFYMLAKAGSYYVVIKHRNHIAAMSHIPISLSADPYLPVNYDFTAYSGYGINGQYTLANGLYALYAGDANVNAEVNYQSPNNDRGFILNKLAAPNDKTKTIFGYWNEDLNLDGKVQYSGAGNDRALILRSIGGTNLSTNISSQVPQ